MSFTGWLSAWSKGRLPPGAMLYSTREPSELLQWLCLDDSAINIVLVIIIISGSDNWCNGVGVRASDV